MKRITESQVLTREVMIASMEEDSPEKGIAVNTFLRSLLLLGLRSIETPGFPNRLVISLTAEYDDEATVQ